jgi:hypothetical protein
MDQNQVVHALARVSSSPRNCLRTASVPKCVWIRLLVYRSVKHSPADSIHVLFSLLGAFHALGARQQVLL